MIRLTRAAFARGMEKLLHTHDTPHRTALAFAIGTFIGFSPLLGLHTVLALAVAFAFSLNRVAVLIGVYVNLPWFLGPYYTLATLTGAVILRTPLPPGILAELERLLGRWPPDEWHRLVELLRPLLWAYLLGSTLLAAIAAGIAYYAALGLVLASRRRHAGSGHA
jgi:hypothetical protein